MHQFLLKRRIKNIIIWITGLTIYKVKANFEYYILNFFNYRNFEKRQENRGIEDIFDYNALSKPLPLLSKSYYKHNSFYGIEKSLKNFIDSNEYFKAVIEHGLYIGDFIEPFSFTPGFKSIITFSDYRKKIISNHTDKKVITVGPYIEYVDYYLNKDELVSLKEKMGNTLLVFPMHSTIQIEYDFDSKKFLNFIKSIRNEYESVLICFYWKDIQLGKHIPFIKAGFKIVCAGHLMDMNFLSRLKTFIHLSDYVVTNSIGTHIGYCIYMNKPLFYFSQNHKKLGNSKNDIEKEIGFRGPNYLKTSEAVNEQIRSKFDIYGHQKISEEQLNLASHLWGFNRVRSKKEFLKWQKNFF